MIRLFIVPFFPPFYKIIIFFPSFFLFLSKKFKKNIYIYISSLSSPPLFLSHLPHLHPFHTFLKGIFNISYKINKYIYIYTYYIIRFPNIIYYYYIHF
ncbi:hypothetical protein BJ944DRAFT_264784 [Cunninghamella echinulata]|nr:hypothetical protein BJ944DRAFT_264784 [Cunninghamella echinulata]